MCALMVGVMLAVPDPVFGLANGWSVVPSPDRSTGENQLGGVSCVSASACTAVGFYASTAATGGGLIESWNGTKWSLVPSPNPGQSTSAALNGVSCVSASACTAVGAYTTPARAAKTLAESWNGTKWSLVPSPNPGQSASAALGSVSCLTTRACVAVGGYHAGPTGPEKTLAESWNGTKWSVVPSPNPGLASGDKALYAVSCVSASACTAVGHYVSNNTGTVKGLIESWNGTRWSVVPSPNPGGNSRGKFLYGVSCLSASICTAVGSMGSKTLAESWNGTKWSVVPSPNPSHSARGAFLLSVSCASASACTAAGEYANSAGVFKTLVESWNGTKWSLVPSPNPASSHNAALSSVSCVSVSVCTAVGSYQNKARVPRTLIESN
jgi:hypothetical protein